MAETKSKRWWIILVVLLLLAAILAGLWYWQSTRLKVARWQAMNPTVLIAQPLPGSAQSAGSWIPVVASATGPQMLQRMELWVDGTLIQTQETELDGGVAVIYSQFELLVQEGTQTFIVRAVDVEGQIGQSDPVWIRGEAEAAEFEPAFQVGFGPETDLAALAADYDIDPEEIFKRNEEALSQPDGVLQIPLDSAEENTPKSSDQVPQELLVENGYVSGKICYPSQYIPEMTAYFENTATGQAVTLPISQNQNTYGIPLPPGNYEAYAWLTDFSLGGAYSKAVPCGLTTSCTDHSLLSFTVVGGDCIKNIDICDWYDQNSVPIPMGQTRTEGADEGGSIDTGTPMLVAVEEFPDGNSWNLPFSMAIPLSSPGSPTNLNTRVNGCQIRLGWDASQPAAEHYLVWITGQNGAKQLAAKLQAEEEGGSSPWYEFKSPLSGPVSVWVEAVNSIGKSPSTVKTVQVGEECGEGDEDLIMEAVELEIDGGYQNVYLYLSVEGRPEERLPADDDQFLPLEDGAVQLDTLYAGENAFSAVQPDDGSLQISGECWGWAGGRPVRISSFNESIPESSWAGTKGTLGDEKCALNFDLDLKKFDDSEYVPIAAPMDVPPPFNVRSEKMNNWTLSIPGFPKIPTYLDYMRNIRWQWKGDVKKINGFTIYYNGQKIGTAPANVRNFVTMIPGGCGDSRWRVVANGKKGQSPSSPITKENLGICPLYAEVVIDYLILKESCDSCCCDWLRPEPFDWLEAYGYVTVGNITRKMGTKNFYIPMKKGGTSGKKMANYSGKERFTVTIPRAPFSLFISTAFFDYDSFSADDAFGQHNQLYEFKTFDQALNFVGNSIGYYNPVGKQYQTGTSSSGTAVTYLKYRMWFYKAGGDQ